VHLCVPRTSRSSMWATKFIFNRASRRLWSSKGGVPGSCHGNRNAACPTDFRGGSSRSSNDFRRPISTVLLRTEFLFGCHNGHTFEPPRCITHPSQLPPHHPLSLSADSRGSLLLSVHSIKSHHVSSSHSSFFAQLPTMSLGEYSAPSQPQNSWQRSF
jgi:hypothetical protein